MIFLPPNTVSVTQPMDKGVIRSLKAHYKKCLVRVILTHLNQDKPIPEISLLKAMWLLVSAWNDIKRQTAINFFRKAKTFEKYQMNAVNDINNLFKELNESLKELETKDSSLVPENVTVQDVAEADDQVTASTSFLTDELILEAL